MVDHDEKEFHDNYTIHPTECVDDIQHDTKLALSLTYWSNYVLLNITWISLSYRYIMSITRCGTLSQIYIIIKSN